VKVNRKQIFLARGSRRICATREQIRQFEDIAVKRELAIPKIFARAKKNVAWMKLFSYLESSTFSL